jgi:CheY-like chemotaxis protein
MPRGGHLAISTANVQLDEAAVKKKSIGVEPGGYVCLTVTDTGCGMDETTRARIFEPFFTTKEAGKGTGLGLSTVFGIVQQSRGGVVVDSVVDRGTTFRVYFPAVQGESAREAVPDEAPKMRPGKETILLVDDEESIRVPLAEFLRLNGYTVLEARNGKEAMIRGETHEGFIDVLVTDVVMPKMGGKSLAEQLTPRHPRMKVLYLSGYAEATIVRRGHLDAGAKLLQKPFAPEALVNRIHELLADAPGA